MKKGRRGIQINFTNRWLYTFITVFLLAAVGVGVYAYGTSTPTTFGHSAGELAPPTGCASGQFLQYTNSSWTCASPSSFPACPSGSTLTFTYTYLDVGGDTYGGQTYLADCDSSKCDKAPADSCDGNWISQYTCSQTETRTCVDSYIPSPGSCTTSCSMCNKGPIACGGCSGNCYYRYVTCVEKRTRRTNIDCIPN